MQLRIAAPIFLLWTLSTLMYGQSSPSECYELTYRWDQQSVSTPQQRDKAWADYEKRMLSEISKGHISVSDWTKRRSQAREDILKPSEPLSERAKLSVGRKSWLYSSGSGSRTRTVIFDGDRTFSIAGRAVIITKGASLNWCASFPLVGLNFPGVNLFERTPSSRDWEIKIPYLYLGGGLAKFPAHVEHESGFFKSAASLEVPRLFGRLSITTSPKQAPGGLHLAETTRVEIVNEYSNDVSQYRIAEASPVPCGVEFSVSAYLKKGMLVQTEDGLRILFDPARGDLESQIDAERLRASKISVAVSKQAESSRSTATVVVVIALAAVFAATALVWARSRRDRQSGDSR